LFHVMWSFLNLALSWFMPKVEQDWLSGNFTSD
jgi:hypothetical protein